MTLDKSFSQTSIVFFVRLALSFQLLLDRFADAFDFQPPHAFLHLLAGFEVDEKALRDRH